MTLLKNILLAILLPALLMADPAEDVLNKIGTAIQKGDVKALSLYFNANIEIDILGTEAVYTKTQAIQVLNDFFNKNKPTAFTLIHKGDSNGNAKFGIGNLSCGKDKFRTYIYIKEKEGKYLIQELRFERE